jgi:hypothetical protein
MISALKFEHQGCESCNDPWDPVPLKVPNASKSDLARALRLSDYYYSAAVISYLLGFSDRKVVEMYELYYSSYLHRYGMLTSQLTHALDMILILT